MIEEKIVVGSGSDFPLNGLLTLPKGNGAPYPAVVLVHGSGSADMDSKVYNVRPFKDFAEGLAKHGIACIRYDKRSFAHLGKFKKLYKNGFTVKEETVEDAVLATNIIKNDSRINPDRVFIAGISLGGMLVPRIDEEGGNYAGLILLAAPARRLEELMKSQAEDFLKASKGLTKWLVKKQTTKMHSKFDNIYALSDEEARKIYIAGGMRGSYLKDAGKKRVGDYLKSTAKPVLVMHGGGDFQVSTEKDFNEHKRILQNNPKALLKLYPGLNHVFMPVVHGDIKRVKEEYSKPQNVADYVIADMAAWIKSI